MEGFSAEWSRAWLPRPFRDSEFRLERDGVHDSACVSVYMSDADQFAFLHPQPAFEYEDYHPRVGRLGLQAYKAANRVLDRRLEKVRHFFNGQLDVLEIGAADASFLQVLREENDRISASAVEPDLRTQRARLELQWLEVFDDVEQVIRSGRKYDRVCAFHVLEHVQRPMEFLDACALLLKDEGLLVIEVPSLDDPLLSLFECKPYKAFYYQTQHPYNYSMASLISLLEASGFSVTERIYHQRYGLENHLTWLSTGSPGGSEQLRAMFSGFDGDYRQAMEISGHSDAAMTVCKCGRPD